MIISRLKFKVNGTLIATASGDENYPKWLLTDLVGWKKRAKVNRVYTEDAVGPGGLASSRRRAGTRYLTVNVFINADSEEDLFEQNQKIDILHFAETVELEYSYGVGSKIVTETIFGYMDEMQEPKTETEDTLGEQHQWEFICANPYKVRRIDGGEAIEVL